MSTGASPAAQKKQQAAKSLLLKKNVPSRICEIIRETHDTVTLVLELDEAIPHIPGQSIGLDPKKISGMEDRVSLVQKVAQEKKVRALTALKLYSLADSSDDYKTLSITIKREEDAEGYPPALLSPYAISDMKVGDQFPVSGPYGKKFLFQPEPEDRFILWGAGSGVVPFNYFLEYLWRKKLPNPLLFFDSNKTPEDIIYRKRLEEIDRGSSTIQVIHTITRPHLSKESWSGRTGRLVRMEDPSKLETARIEEDILQMCPFPVETALHYSCGPVNFAYGVKHALLHLGVPEEQIFVEAWG